MKGCLDFNLDEVYCSGLRDNDGENCSNLYSVLLETKENHFKFILRPR